MLPLELCWVPGWDAAGQGCRSAAVGHSAAPGPGTERRKPRSILGGERLQEDIKERDKPWTRL